MALRIKLLLPLVLAVLLLATWAGIRNEFTRMTYETLLASLALLTLVITASVEAFVMRPLQGLKRIAHHLTLKEFDKPELRPGSRELRELAVSLAQLRDMMRGYDERLAQETARRQKLEKSLRELEERYALTVERASDGIWEWDMESGKVEFSLRWKGMLGYLDTGIAGIDEWKGLIHAEDREAVLLRLDNHLKALTPHFDAEYRLRHRDNRYRWVGSRGTAIRHASGKPYRMIVMDNDIHARKELEETLIQAAEGLSSVSGMDFFQALMKNLSAILGTRDNLVCYCADDPPTRAQTLAYYSSGKFWDNFEYELEGTSCGAVIARKETVYVPTGVCDIWPEEKQYDRDSYIGVPMFDSTGKIIGHFACMDGKPMRQDLPHLAIFKIFSVRAAAELERTLLKQKLGMHSDAQTG